MMENIDKTIRLETPAGYYKKLIVITNRHLCHRPYLAQLERVAALKPKALILREKDLDHPDYLDLATKAQAICQRYEIPFFVHSDIEAALTLHCDNIQLSISQLRECMSKDNHRLHAFRQISVSCHSPEDVQEAIALGATQIILGTIFETDCKKGLKGRGLDFVREITAACPLPVYAIGGIKESNLKDILQAGAAGGCMMSGFMTL